MNKHISILFSKPRYIVGLIAALIIIIMDIIYLFRTPYFVPMIVVAITIAWVKYWIDFFLENNRQRQIESMFPEFVRNLVGSIKSGMPLTKAITHVADADYRALNPYVKKLKNQVEWGIPVHKSLLVFGMSTNNKAIQRAITTVIEAEESGGNIEDVLDSITNSLVEIKKIKDKRKAAVHSQIVQNYIIFFVFIGVIIVIQNMLIPYIMGVQSGSFSEFGGGGKAIVQKVQIDLSSISSFFSSVGNWFKSLNGVFLMLALIQGFFAGIVIGKLSEGHVRFGIKHSLILMTLAFFVLSLAQGWIGI